jgi:hypothetical protein
MATGVIAICNDTSQIGPSCSTRAHSVRTDAHVDRSLPTGDNLLIDSHPEAILLEVSHVAPIPVTGSRALHRRRAFRRRLQQPEPDQSGAAARVGLAELLGRDSAVERNRKLLLRLQRRTERQNQSNARALSLAFAEPVAQSDANAAIMRNANA